LVRGAAFQNKFQNTPVDVGAVLGDEGTALRGSKGARTGAKCALRGFRNDKLRGNIGGGISRGKKEVKPVLSSYSSQRSRGGNQGDNSGCSPIKFRLGPKLYDSFGCLRVIDVIGAANQTVFGKNEILRGGACVTRKAVNFDPQKSSREACSVPGAKVPSKLKVGDALGSQSRNSGHI